jgi:choline dehydrogenase-like flavoprotein
MLIDFRTDALRAVDTDLCIIGAGAAGITIARSMLGAGLDVCLVESGGYDFEPETQALYASESVGLPLGFDLDASRLRFFGGTTNHWGGGCIPLFDMDFRERQWAPHSGWPITRTDLDPYYQRALEVCQLGAKLFNEDSRTDGSTPVLWDPARLVNIEALGGSTVHFGEAYRAELERAGNVRVLLFANLVELQTNDANSVVRQARFRTLDGKEGIVRARCFVLACGGVENARLLLLSDTAAPRGLGNEHDLVGRFFMDHPSARLGILATEDTDHPAIRKRVLTEQELTHVPDIRLSNAVQEKQGLLGARFRLSYREDSIPDGVRAMRELEAGLRGGNSSGVSAKTVLRIAADLGDVIPGLYSWLRGRSVVEAHHVDCHIFIEQAPNPDSRVTLSDDLDALGQRKVRLDWRLTELDRQTSLSAAMLFGAELARANLGRLQLDPWLLPGGDVYSAFAGVAHHLGTTRMADDPRNGVVNGDGRVHGVDNLFVAGSSVFPTGGCTWPTFTIVALALRMSDHLRRRLG